MEPIIVVKIGGSAGTPTEPLLDELARRGPAVLVHGFSREATLLGEKRGVPPRFVTSPSGHRSRFTDDATLAIVHEAAARVNGRLVEGLQRRGVPAVGLLAGDAGVTALHKDALRSVTDAGRTVLLRGDRSGSITGVDAWRLRDILAAGRVPVVAPIARTPDGALASLDGDRCAAAIAGALGARRLVILTNVPGVLRDAADRGTVLPTLDLRRMDETRAFIRGAMKRKVLAAREALQGGVPDVHIAPAGSPDPVASALAGAGTRVVGP